jgi:hypothetical protein
MPTLSTGAHGKSILLRGVGYQCEPSNGGLAGNNFPVPCAQ